MLDIIGKRIWFLSVSGIFALLCVIFLVAFGLKMGIEFSSGSMMTVGFEQKVEQSDLEEELASLGYTNAIVQSTGAGDFFIRTRELSGGDKTALESALTVRFGSLMVGEFDSVSPMIATETARNAAIAIVIASIGILLYITWAFRRMPSPLHYGTCGVIALALNMMVVLGVFALLGAILKWQINLMFITGILAVIGYSVNNTVVIFDRIRENLKRGVSPKFEVVVNNSLIESLGRSFNTSITTLIVVLALLLFVGATIQNFAVVLLIGIVFGTFSSIYIAPPLLVVWEKGEWRRLLTRLPWSAARAKSG